MSPVTIRTRKVRLDNHGAPTHPGGSSPRTLILVTSSTGRQQQPKTNHRPAILNHRRNVITIPAAVPQAKTVIISPRPGSGKTSTHTRPIILAENNIVTSPASAPVTPAGSTVIYAGSRAIRPALTPGRGAAHSSAKVTRILTTSAGALGGPIKTIKTPARVPSDATPPHRKTFVNIVSSGGHCSGDSSAKSAYTTAAGSCPGRGTLLQQRPGPPRCDSPAPWSTSASAVDIAGLLQKWSRPCSPNSSRPGSPSLRSLPRPRGAPRWPTVDPSYEAPKLGPVSGSSPPWVGPGHQGEAADGGSPGTGGSSSSSPGTHVTHEQLNTTDDNGNIIKQEIKTEIKEEIDDSLPLDSILLAPLKRPLTEMQIQDQKKKTKISIAQDNKLGPVKEHVNTVFEHYGVTPSFSPNMEKLIEITGTTALNYLLYVDWCKKKGIKTVNQETYGRLFRNEFKKLVGTR